MVYAKLGFAVLTFAVVTANVARAQEEDIPSLLGTWVGENKTISDKKGYRDWGTKIIQITEQKDRRFRGQFTYEGGTVKFFGVIYPDNVSFTWVSSSKGYNHGRILSADRSSACYVEAGEEATAGCADLTRRGVQR